MLAVKNNVKLVYMNSFEFKSYGDHIVAYDDELVDEFPLQLFDPRELSSDLAFEYIKRDASIGTGRKGIHQFKFQNKYLILRHYYRGGWAAKFTSDHYFWRGLYCTRSIQELNMLSDMFRMNLPVPRPIAAHVQKFKTSYTADIVTEKISHSKPLSRVLQGHSLSNDKWQEIGYIIKRFHTKKCNHADLNAHNILIDGTENIFLIDFDKSKIENSIGKWCDRNLNRLKRSLEKLSQNSPENMQTRINYKNQNFVELLKGYKI